MLIVGCGYVGERLGRALRAGGEPVAGVVRSHASAARLAAAGIEPVVADLDRGPPVLASAGTRLCYLAPPPASGIVDTRLAHLIDGFAAGGDPARILYLGTTAVYGDCGGAWVDESRPPRPATDRGRRRLDAEERLRAWRARSGGELVILRVGGIYGPGRLPLERLRQRLPLVREEEAPYSNRIHVDDLVAVVLAALARAADGAVYNVSDGHPTTMTDYFSRLADLAGLPRPPLIPLAEAEARLSAGMASYMRESRRLDSRRLRDELGVELRYPTLDRGLAAALGS